jgi:hypothetical protein
VVLRWARLALLCVIGLGGFAAAGSFTSIRYQTERATLHFEPGQLTREEMARFAAIADRGVADVASYLGAERGARWERIQNLHTSVSGGSAGAEVDR